MNWLRQKMIGRYGGDQLGIGILIFGMALSFVPYWPAKIVSMALMVLEIVRMFSRNITRRRMENERFLRVWYPVKKFFTGIFRPRPDAKTHKRFRCKCGQTLRVPRGKGTVRITCPKCGNVMTKRT